ncbi:MAG: M23 family metallopeptidase, partial [Clostridiaceae bacterium]|nr:M23 family metallopeptidase [Clostridiaceae bacterium]
GVIGSFFGERVHPIKGNTEFHKGIDIEAQNGTAIKAAYDGEVVEAGEEATFGKYIKIKHDESITSLYAHCSSLNKKKGEKVNKGDIIAKVGSTGLSQGPHLHFEIWKDEEAVNPLDYIGRLPD